MEITYIEDDIFGLHDNEGHRICLLSAYQLRQLETSILYAFFEKKFETALNLKKEV